MQGERKRMGESATVWFFFHPPRRGSLFSNTGPPRNGKMKFGA